MSIKRSEYLPGSTKAKLRPVETERRRDWQWAESFGRRLQDALTDRGLSKVDAGRILGVAPARLGEYVNGTRVPPADTLDELTVKLDLDPSILFPHWFASAKRHAGFRRRRAAREEAAAVAVAVAKG